VIAAAMLAALFGVLLCAALADVARLRIPNSLVLAAVGLFLPYTYASGMALAEIGLHVGAGVAVLVAGFVLFSAGLRFGAGDAKLFAALALWSGFSGLPALVAFTGFIGGGIALVVVLLRASGIGWWLGARGWSAPALTMDGREPYVPYGPAMALAFVCTIYTAA